MRVWLALVLAACACGDDGEGQRRDPVVSADAGAATDGRPASSVDAEAGDPTDPYEPY
jgi:hypothetical protein